MRADLLDALRPRRDVPPSPSSFSPPRYSNVDAYPVAQLRKIADSLAEDLKVGQWSARTLTLKLKLETFESLTRAKTLGKDIFFSDAETLYRYVLIALLAFPRRLLTRRIKT